MPDADAPEWLAVPYAEVPYSVGRVRGLQRLNRAVAERLANAMARALRVEPRLAGGLPFYVGHPDFFDPADAEQVNAWLQRQPPSYGWIKEFRATDAALELRVAWNPEGLALVNSRTYRFFSPFFRSEPTVTENGVQIYEPRLIQSAGLTNTPNWPMPPMVNAAVTTGGTEGGMTLLQRLIALLGDATITDDDGLVAAVQKLLDACAKIRQSVDARWKAEDAARAALPNAGDPLALLEGYLARTDGLLAAANAGAAALEETRRLAETLGVQLKEARSAHAADLVNAAVSRGAVLQEHAAARIADLANAGDAFAARAAELAALPPLMKTRSEAGDVAGRSTEIAGRRARLLELVNAALPAHGGNYDKAFAAVSKKHPELLGGSPAQ